MLNIQIFGPMTFAESETFLETSGFNEACRQYERDIYERYTRDLAPDDLAQVEEWWNGKVRTDFWQVVRPDAYSSIASLISWGLG